MEARRPSHELRDATANPSHFVDYQDCKISGGPTASRTRRCSAAASPACVTRGPPGKWSATTSAAWRSWTPSASGRSPTSAFQEYTDQRQVATRNAIDVQIVDGRLRLYLIADDDESDLLVYEAR